MSGPKSYELSEKELKVLAKRAMDQRIRVLENNKEKLLDDFNRQMKAFNKLRSDFNSLSKQSEAPSKKDFCEIKENLIKQTLTFTESKKYDKSLITENDTANNDDENGKEAFEAALNEYISACIFAQKDVPDCFQFDSERSEEFTAFLKRESQRIMNEAINELVDQEAYQASIDVLKEMGYSVIGVNNVNGIRSTLLRVKDNIGVNIITSTDSDGTARYTYEVVGITDDGHNVTDDERETILRSMSKMCLDEFTEFISKIEEKGFAVKNMIDRPPNVKYCKNKCVSDYAKIPENAQKNEYGTAAGSVHEFENIL